eukprot:1721079-Rhodomonas_salina.2
MHTVHHPAGPCAAPRHTACTPPPPLLPRSLAPIPLSGCTPPSIPHALADPDAHLPLSQCTHTHPVPVYTSPHPAAHRPLSRCTHTHCQCTRALCADAHLEHGEERAEKASEEHRIDILPSKP